MVKPTDTSKHSAAAAARGATAGAGAGAAEAAPRARASDSSLHAQIASGTKHLLGRDVSRMDLSPLFTSKNGLKKDGSDLTRNDVLRAYFTNATPETQAEITSFLLAYKKAQPHPLDPSQTGTGPLDKLSQSQRDDVIMKMIPDEFMIAYLIETVDPDKVEGALISAGIDMPAQYAAIGELVTKCAPEGVKFPDGMTPEEGKEYFFNSYHGDTDIARFISIFETCDGLPTDVLAESKKPDHGLPIEFVNQGFVGVTMDLKEKMKGPHFTRYNATEKGLLLIPKEIFQLKHLEHLLLDKNQIYSIPDEISQLTQLEGAGFKHNNLSSIPPEIGNLSNLRNLFLNHNQISSVPPELSKLKELRQLFLNNNQIKTLPPELAQLSGRCTLLFQHNFLTDLPDGLGSIARQLTRQEKPTPTDHGSAGAAAAGATDD